MTKKEAQDILLKFDKTQVRMPDGLRPIIKALIVMVMSGKKTSA